MFQSEIIYKPEVFRPLSVNVIAYLIEKITNNTKYF